MIYLIIAGAYLLIGMGIEALQQMNGYSKQVRNTALTRVPTLLQPLVVVLGLVIGSTVLLIVIPIMVVTGLLYLLGGQAFINAHNKRRKDVR